MEKGTGLPGYGNPEPVPVPEHTRDHIFTVLPVPVSYLNMHSIGEEERGEHSAQGLGLGQPCEPDFTVM